MTLLNSPLDSLLGIAAAAANGRQQTTKAKLVKLVGRLIDRRPRPLLLFAARVAHKSQIRRKLEFVGAAPLLQETRLARV